MSDTRDETLDTARARRFIDAAWGDSIVPTLKTYIGIPNKSPAFDPDWIRHGFIDQAVALAAGWVEENLPPGATVQTVRRPGCTPLLFVEVPGSAPGTVLLYGHLDKQPEMTGWSEGLDPWTPVLRGDRLYGRGSADDGYAVFAALTAIRALQEQGVPHARCVLVIEACEESGSYDLPGYVDLLSDRIGEPDLVVCLDSGCGNYDQLWCTTSLRGTVIGDLRVEVLSEGVHSGDASGIVPSSFRVLRALLERVEDAQTGAIRLPELHADIPARRLDEARRAAEVLGADTYSKFPLVSGVRPVSDDPLELILNRTWRPALSCTGVEGIPALKDAGNVLRPLTAVKLSMRLPPTTDADAAGRAMKDALETDPPHGVRASFDGAGWQGWDAPPTQSWLHEAVDRASRAWFGAPAMAMGEGGSIPFMSMLGERYPAAQFIVTGVLGPHSNAHGPNEFLHLPTARKVTGCVADVLVAHAARRG